jgi:antitoxin component of MazEF toxin-antitoxin module
MYVNLKIKKIGGSLFGRFDAQDAKALKLKEEQVVKMKVEDKPDYMAIFGIAKGVKTSGQEFKDEMRDWLF